MRCFVVSVIRLIYRKSPWLVVLAAWAFVGHAIGRPVSTWDAIIGIVILVVLGVIAIFYMLDAAEYDD